MCCGTVHHHCTHFLLDNKLQKPIAVLNCRVTVDTSKNMPLYIFDGQHIAYSSTCCFALPKAVGNIEHGRQQESRVP